MLTLILSLTFELVLPYLLLLYIEINYEYYGAKTKSEDEFNNDSYDVLAVAVVTGLGSVICSFLSFTLYKKAGSRMS